MDPIQENTSQASARLAELDHEIETTGSKADQAQLAQDAKDTADDEVRQKESVLKAERDRLDAALKRRRFSIKPVSGLTISPSDAIAIASDGVGHTDNAILAHALLQQGFDPFDHKNSKPYREVVVQLAEEKKS